MSTFGPNEQQSAILEWARSCQGSAIVNALAGTGKCLGRGTLVMKFDGSIVPVESIKVSDLLMGPDSTPRTVTSISQGIGPLYKITPIKGDPWVCNDAHIMTLMKTNNPNSGSIIDAPLLEHIKHPNVDGRIDKQWKLFRVPLSFTENEVPYDPYMIGAWLGDGTIHEPEWTLGLKKESILKYLSELAPTMGFRPSVRWADRTNTWNISYRIRTLGQKGHHREKHPFKSYIERHLMVAGEKRIPRCYLVNTSAVRKAMLAGLLDTDGSLSSPVTFDFVTKYKGLSEDVLFLCRSLGLSAYCTEKQVKLDGWNEPRTYYRISISGCFKDYTFLRHESNTRLQVKDVLRTGWTAEPIGVGEYFGFTLSGDGRFLLGDFTVTHNTTLLCHMASVISGKSLFCAFNKAIAEELKSRLAPYPHCEAATLHSTGLKLYRRLRSRFEIESRKVRYITKDQMRWNNDRKSIDIIVDAVDSAKQRGVGIPGYPHWEDGQVWADIFEQEDLIEELPAGFKAENAYEMARRVYAKSMALCEDREPIIDFNDMLLAPLVMGGEGSWTQQYDWVLIDELQDCNEVRRLMAVRVLKSGGRLCGVGDAAQAIYGFSGADSNSMELMKKRFPGCVEYPLSVTYRCPKVIVALAQQWVPQYEAAEHNPDGIIRNIDHKDFWKEEFTSADVILCRNTRPLVGIARRLRKQFDIPCVVEGYSPKGLIALAEKWGDITIAGFTDRVKEYREIECAKLEAKRKEEKAERLSEKVQVLLELCDDLEPDDGVQRLVKQIEKMFGQPQDGGNQPDILHLCTIHRGKGREWNRVYLVGRNRYQPSYWATKSEDPEALQQEENLQYVAVTRTKVELVEVEVPMPKKDEEVDWWEL